LPYKGGLPPPANRYRLQPLVENAVKHGALMREGGGEITVRAELVGPKLVCTIEDNGPGIPNKAMRPGAFGLVSVRRRLALRYSEAAIESSFGRALFRVHRNWLINLTYQGCAALASRSSSRPAARTQSRAGLRLVPRRPTLREGTFQGGRGCGQAVFWPWRLQ
jgi:hypothetical protein